MVDVLKAWQVALDFWNATPQLKEPREVNTTEEKNHSAIAYINLETRQVVYNYEWHHSRGILDALPAVFAHELGHHLRFPHSLKTSAELHLLAQTMIPGLPFMFLNIFWDLLVNQAVGEDPDLRKQLIRVYQGSLKDQSEVSELYANYLTIYEYLWNEEGIFKLTVEEKWKPLLKKFAQDFYQLEDFYEQFLYFLSYFVRFVASPNELVMTDDPFAGDAPTPSAEDYPSAGQLSKKMEDAIKKAKERGWMNPETENSPGYIYDNLQRTIGQLPGNQEGNLKKSSDRYYRSLINKYIESMPKKMGQTFPEAILPSVLESWEMGDEFQDIDWQETVARTGNLAAINLLKRERIADDPTHFHDGEHPKFEIYLDTSGSMPDPMTGTNTMTLAALILGTYAVRKKGRVKGIIYSSGPIHTSEWMQSEDKIREFFLKYIGGGTDFPFDHLQKQSLEEKDVYRIIISDTDFIHNCKESEAPKYLKTVLPISKKLITVLAGVSRENLFDVIGIHLNDPKFSFIQVKDFEAFAEVSTSLARALLGENT